MLKVSRGTPGRQNLTGPMRECAGSRNWLSQRYRKGPFELVYLGTRFAALPKAHLLFASHALPINTGGELVGICGFRRGRWVHRRVRIQVLYNFWRPVSAIRQADTAGNANTNSDSSWNSFLVTPNFPEWPSAHAVAGAAMAEVLADYFGTDLITFSATSGGANPDIRRSFASFSAAAKRPIPRAGRNSLSGEYLRGTQNGTAHRRLRFSELLETLCRSRARRPRSATIRLAATVVTRKGSRASGIIAQPESIFWLWQCDKENYGWCEGRPLTVAAKFRSGRERRCRWKMRDVWLEDYVEHYNDVNEYDAAGC